MTRLAFLAPLVASLALPAPARADAPAIDLVSSRARLHCLRGSTLVVDFLGEGFRKYVQEYTSPWRAVSGAGPDAGRALSARLAKLNLPWTGATEGASLVVRTAGSPGKLAIVVNGKRPKVTLGDRSARVDLPPGLLRAGENRVELWPNGKSTRVRAVELGPALEADLPPGPRLEGDRRAAALVGCTTLRLYQEIPEGARLSFSSSGGPAHLTVRAIPEAGAARTLLDGTVPAAGTFADHTASLGELANQLVLLEIATDAPPAATVAFAVPRIQLADAPSRPRPPAYPNGILFVVDALRSDRLAVYGETRVKTPVLTAAAKKEGVVFLRSQAASPSSPPSHGSIQTGMSPRGHGVGGDAGQPSPGTPSISATLAKAGLSTAYIGNNGFGMNRLSKISSWKKQAKAGDCFGLVKATLEFARGEVSAGRRFFVSMLPMDVHTPYRWRDKYTPHYFDGTFDDKIGRSPDGVVLGAIMNAKLEMTDARWAQLKAQYDGGVEMVDACLGKLQEGLAELGVADKTAIIVTADHGEGMFEHKKLGHAFGLWAELGNVPFVVLAPGLQPRVLDLVVHHADLAPTMIDLLGEPVDPRMQGESLLPAALRDGPPMPRVGWLEFGRSYALKTRMLRYFVDYGGKERLYDELADPTDQQEIQDARPIALRAMRDLGGLYLAFRGKWRGSWGTLYDQRPGMLEEAARAASEPSKPGKPAKKAGKKR